MPRGTQHIETGLLLEGPRPTILILQRDDGGVWQLDASAAAWSFLGMRVRVYGTRAGFDLLDVDRVVLATEHGRKLRAGGGRLFQVVISNAARMCAFRQPRRAEYQAEETAEKSE